MAKEWDPETVFDVFGREEIRGILALADEEPMSAEDLAARLSVSQPTVYRYIDVC
ncbi:HTH domain-containing protein [Halorubrum sp. CBA1125]|uniref:HTH domain-containing protein n=1 Tax=Halorubrum sp. CBA1125 TaxID=2668072 RepID=UPI0012E8696F|nr:winged helix-turn-helix domain-containing protein [Halorubrum sp. CBA1125]MUW14500.1 HTH domain-containing protein [Halorubrum sp. CBA1125]